MLILQPIYYEFGLRAFSHTCVWLNIFAIQWKLLNNGYLFIMLDEVVIHIGRTTVNERLRCACKHSNKSYCAPVGRFIINDGQDGRNISVCG